MMLSLRERKDIAILDPNNFTRQGIAALLLELDENITIKASVRSYDVLHMVLDKWHINLLFISENIAGQPGFSCLACLKKIKKDYPDLMICLYSEEYIPSHWLRNNIDAFFSLKDAMPVWQAKAASILKDFRRPNKYAAPRLHLTQAEWQILYGLKSGHSLTAIAQKEKLSYHRVSALKVSATRKLGLKNKADLLVFLSH
ncbi:LuxR C-terminal-related transcriptional regulator [Mixta tenebrionis]|uniref:Response regulator transcription factor n=1 Tax=Mixta tenebrionis TaxID=2562439 RepID=A0A506V5M4_9GAMM|nr:MULTISPECIES: LuxR C-terminal-related transcriptional regulator [Mixta]QHM76274.1 Transcriptional regulatory protein RcsB [Mixta theicola]TPW41201.1 response regulator transcription factor [Mixta tenebrionis]